MAGCYEGSKEFAGKIDYTAYELLKRLSSIRDKVYLLKSLMSLRLAGVDMIHLQRIDLKICEKKIEKRWRNDREIDASNYL